MGGLMIKTAYHFALIWALSLISACRRPQLASIKPRTELSAFFDVRPTERVSYLYAPGMMNTEIGMMRYCPEFTASTGEKVRCRSGGQVIGQPHSAVRFPEIDVRKPTYFTLNPLTYLANRLRQSLAPLAQRFMQDALDFTVIDNPDSTESIIRYGFNFSKANLGQKRDIKTMHAAYLNHLQLYPDTDIVLYGDSRGAATIFNFIALHQPTRVKAAVLDGIFDSVPHTVKHFAYTDKEQCEEETLYNLVRFVMRDYKHSGINQRECAEIISDDVPLLLVTSLKDGLVAPQSAFYLYTRLRERGHQKVHLLVLKSALHPAYMITDPTDKKIYEAVVHTFYRTYGLPHNARLATRGETDFRETQPTAHYLQNNYNLPTCPYCDAAQPETLDNKKITSYKRMYKKEPAGCCNKHIQARAPIHQDAGVYVPGRQL